MHGWGFPGVGASISSQIVTRVASSARGLTSPCQYTRNHVEHLKVVLLY